MKRPPCLAAAFAFAVPASLALLLPSCSLLGLRQQVESLEAQGGIAIQVTPPPKGPAPTYALAWRMEGDKRKDSAGFQEVREDGLAAFHLRLGQVYRVGAFTDENKNQKYDAGEPLGFLKDVSPRPLSDGVATAKILPVTLTRTHGLPKGTVIERPKENLELGGKMNVALGDVASLREARFAPDTGGSGLWRPLDFLTTNTLGIYFTEPFDPKRIPVVFVYGIGGSPQDWDYFIKNFDRSKYQLWFYHYPSGMRLSRVSNVLAEGLRALKHRYGFPKAYVVAHSMGGLVARPAITEAVAEEGVDFIPEFVSISTPWGGHKAAEAGIRHLKKPVPSWIDVAPGSDYLVKMYNTPLPKGTTHHLIYGSIKGGPFYLRGENDGVVTVESETDLRVKKAAKSWRHFIHGHVDILNEAETLKLVESELDGKG
ncbi:alpha/beta fold hydrolase [Roseimicrobium sp. ORNL1]|uniref:alpha/beta fold hydrolase n=1 Tax=Roseimicrobium sp. ORNL1 TaxID=2711231 RepID=UPI0013E1499E|nr:alpha/beta fold hydrolase [Roseimicrobium sp. ORNL1]QIF01496.1 alpha/beta hydrolase [Roseimicrobium sp. ORNL1]